MVAHEASLHDSKICPPGWAMAATSDNMNALAVLTEFDGSALVSEYSANVSAPGPLAASNMPPNSPVRRRLACLRLALCARRSRWRSASTTRQASARTGMGLGQVVA